VPPSYTFIVAVGFEVEPLVPLFTHILNVCNPAPVLRLLGGVGKDTLKVTALAEEVGVAKTASGASGSSLIVPRFAPVKFVAVKTASGCNVPVEGAL
jgi:hypothetical protein